MLFRVYFILFALAMCFRPAFAAVKLPAIFSDHMVVQRDEPIKVWGTAKPGEKVQVSLAEQKVSCVANKGGNWHVVLEEVQLGPAFELKIQGENLVTIKDVIAGDVFLCVGQSENLPPLKQLPGGKAADAASSINSNLRLFVVPRRLCANPNGTLQGKWKSSAASSDQNFLNDCSSMAVYLGKNLQYKLKVPVAVIDCTVSNTPIAAWISADRLVRTPAVQAAAPGATKNAVTAATPSSVYNGMVAPLVGFGLKAICWSQGLSDLGNSVAYRKLFTSLIRDWRARWAQEPDVPFAFVQLPSSSLVKSDPALENSDIASKLLVSDEAWSDLRDAQASALAIGSTTMVVTSDYKGEEMYACGSLPKRMAQAILARFYDEKVSAYGPVFESYSKTGNKISVRFKDGAGLKLNTKDGEQNGFEILDTKGKPFPAEATIVEDHLVVQNAGVINPIEVRYDWKGATAATLFNSANLPAAPFRINIR